MALRLLKIKYLIVDIIWLQKAKFIVKVQMEMHVDLLMMKGLTEKSIY